MKTFAISQTQMEQRVARFQALKPLAIQQGDVVPQDARDVVYARKLLSVIGLEGTAKTPINSAAPIIGAGGMTMTKKTIQRKTTKSARFATLTPSSMSGGTPATGLSSLEEFRSAKMKSFLQMLWRARIRMRFIFPKPQAMRAPISSGATCALPSSSGLNPALTKSVFRPARRRGSKGSEVLCAAGRRNPSSI